MRILAEKRKSKIHKLEKMNKSFIKNKTAPVVSKRKNGKWENGVNILKNETMYVEDLDQSRYTIDEIFKRQKTDFRVRNLFFKFQSDLARHMEEKRLYWWASVHSYGVTYFCNNIKAFLFMNIKSTHFVLQYYTGDRSINGIEKSTWSKGEDKKGSKPFKIKDSDSIQKAINFAVFAYRIAEDESKKNKNSF